MTPQHFHGQTHVLEAPRQWDHEREGECGALPLRVVDGGCLSLWKPNADELATLNQGGAVSIWVEGPQHVMAVGSEPADALIVPA